MISNLNPSVYQSCIIQCNELTELKPLFLVFGVAKQDIFIMIIGMYKAYNLISPMEICLEYLSACVQCQLKLIRNIILIIISFNIDGNSKSQKT